MTRPRHAFQRDAAYATASDFCRIFSEDMKNLYWLSLVLTGDPGQAERCFVSGLDDCFAGNRVFKEWARSWARRTIIKNAIRLVSPMSASATVNDTSLNWATHAAGDHMPVPPKEISAILELAPFDRFAFVMSVLEGLSDQDCALLLGCTVPALVAGRIRALQRLSRSIVRPGRSRSDESAGQESQDNRAVIEFEIPPRLSAF